MAAMQEAVTGLMEVSRNRMIPDPEEREYKRQREEQVFNARMSEAVATRESSERGQAAMASALTAMAVAQQKAQEEQTKQMQMQMDMLKHFMQSHTR